MSIYSNHRLCVRISTVCIVIALGHFIGLEAFAQSSPSTMVVSVPPGTPAPGISVVNVNPNIDLTLQAPYQLTMGISAQAGANSMLQMRSMMSPSVTFPLYSGVVTIPSNTSPLNAGGVSAFNGIVYGQAGGVGGITSSMVSICDVTDCNAWASNLVVRDVVNETPTGATNQAINGEEIDLRAYNASHKAIHGIDIQAHIFQPTNGVAIGFSCLTTEAYPWDACLSSGDNAANTGLYIGALATAAPNLTGKGQPTPRTANESSQYLKFGYTAAVLNPATGAASEQAASLQVIPLTAGGSVLQFHNLGNTVANVMADGLEIGSTSANLKGVGTVNAETGYYVHGNAGVSCSGPPTAGFTVTNGIVTHC